MDMVSDAVHIQRQAQDDATRVTRVDTAAGQGEYLTFRLGAEGYAIDILHVQEIRSYEAPTRIANASPHVRGVVNLRGVIVPILDLRLKLGCDRADFDGSTATVVLNLRGRVVGVVVDSVSDVIALGAGQIKPAPELADGGSACIVGIASVTVGDHERMLILMDIASLVGGDVVADWPVAP
jgi:purine-binding chemotaxis protein CheW